MPTTPRRPAVRWRSRGAAAAAAVALIISLAPALALSADAAPVATAAPADSLWTPTANRVQSSSDGHRRRVNPSSYRAYTLDAGALDALLNRAPDEAARGAAPARIGIPAPNGELVAFEIVESPVLENELAARYPAIRTFAGKAVRSTATVRFDVTPAGFHASVRGAGAAWFVDPAYQGDDSLYLSYLGADLPERDRQFVEPELDERAAEQVSQADERIGEGPNGLARQREYRLALLTDRSYAEYFAPGANDAASNAAVLAEKTTLVNRVDHVYGDDVGVRMTLINETNLLNFNTAAEETGANGPCGLDPCFPVTGSGSIPFGCTSALLGRTRLVIGQVVGAHSFDVGHIGLGIDGGGIASLGVVGGSNKAQGCTGLSTPDGDLYAVDYVAHEIGHQFDADHTFNGNQESCSGGNRSAASSVEPGSGSSVMAYAGICQQDNLQPHSDPYFSQRSQAQIGSFVNSTLGNVTEIHSAAFTGFGGTDSFTLEYPSGTTVPITRGTNYTETSIKDAIEAILPPGYVVIVTSHFDPFGSLDDSGFQVNYVGAAVGVNVPNPTLNATGFTGFVNDIAQGGPADNGGVTMATPGNHNPTVIAPADKFIPMRTPFALTGSAEDSDGDELLYLWEQDDRGGAAGTALTTNAKANGPLFRVFGEYADVTPAGTLEYESPGENLADGSPTRVFPDMAQVLADNTNAETGACPAPPDPPDPPGGGTNVPVPTIECYAEFLPTSAYIGDMSAGNTEPSLNFRLTARDQAGPNGGTEFDDVKLRIDKTAGPFQVTSQPTAVSYTGGTIQTVTWDVANTAKPSLAPNVQIRFSTDGGQTFPRVMQASTPNDGSALVHVPVGDTTTGRIRISAVGNYFFDVNDGAINVSGGVSDTTAPNTTITSGPANNSYLLARSATFGFSSNETGATFACTLDGVARTCATSPVTLTRLTRRTHLFSVAATDLAGNPDATPATRRFTVPLDDRNLQVDKGRWKRKSHGSAYLGTVSKVTNNKGATLSRSVSHAKALALVVTKRPSYGRVAVLLGGTKLKTVNLKGPARNRVVIPIATFGTPRSGKVRIVVKNNKQVRIDGLGVVT